MFHHIKGKVIEVNPAFVIIETAGMGYQINITLNTYSAISSTSEVLLFLLPIYKEDSQTLFGFINKQEREIFSKLLSVSGVGGNTARVILSSLSADEAINAIATENVGLLKSVKGIGAKTAQRIIVDLKDKVGAVEALSAQGGTGALAAEAVSALEVLGYPSRQTERVILNLQKQDPQQSLEELIKKALNKL
jgi:Holliday junction DNA helicase RuvA